MEESGPIVLSALSVLFGTLWSLPLGITVQLYRQILPQNRHFGLKGFFHEISILSRGF